MMNLTFQYKKGRVVADLELAQLSTNFIIFYNK